MNRESTDNPKVSVTLVVPVKNEEASLGEFWGSITWQRAAPAEIVFVEAGSSDRTKEILDEIRVHDPRVKVVSAPGAYPGTARNSGIEAAKYPVIALADCGTVLSPAWLEELVSVYSTADHCDVVYGTFEPIRDGAVAKWGSIAFLPPVRKREGGLNRGETLASLLLTSEVWSRIGRLPPWRAAEDLDFLNRLRETRVAAAVAPQAVAYWHGPSTVRETFWKLALYSRHNVWAGRERQWHYGVARIYAASIGAGALAWAAGNKRCPLRRIGEFLGISLVARTARHLWKARHSDPPLKMLGSGEAVGVALMILIGDAATLVGWLTARMRHPPAAYARSRVD